ncbi:hypothetical protein WOLCODRAFT_94261 [Wolfiporia cocos MD-104 SS10]|uniref:F-box domain-containing protein n=1 Tax=Wolfiporia cocos (strain MD-104) TaxID=742152 RepID=A0A2H3IVR6_WOLCO|nr:hypothetical protein WOLCODRAFT_94261 [Wolfiporia cocos MD-104 SS10]
MAATSAWNSLPAEMKLAVADLLDFHDVKSLSTVNKETYSLCVPSIFRCVKIPNFEAMQSYLATVPGSYNQYIRQLHVSTKRTHQVAPSPGHHPVTDALSDLLEHCSQVERLTLEVESSPNKSLIPCFTKLCALTSLTINHCGDETLNPLSERLVVSIAASIPNLTALSLDRVARSRLHAPELLGAYPSVPIVDNDDDIPEHPLLGCELRLPSLLRLSALKRLRIRDTHLGDPQWACTPVHCSLEVLDLGSCYYESTDYNRICTERIMANVGHTVDEFALNTALTPQTFEYAKHKEAPLKRLRKVHLTPLFPVENVVDTLTTLSGSPIEELAVQCHEDDVLDMCSALEDFLNLRAERGEQALYQHLTEITVRTVSDLADGLFGPFGIDTKAAAVGELLAEHADAVHRLQDYLRDLRAASNDSISSAASRLPGGVSSDASVEKPSPEIAASVVETTA